MSRHVPTSSTAFAAAVCAGLPPALRIARAAPGARGAPFPGYIEPLLATPVPKLPKGDQWVHEIKFDGYRLQLHKREATIQCFTRRGYDWTERFPTLTAAVWPLQTHAAILDGEAVVVTPEGDTDFSALESYVSSKGHNRSKHNLVHYAFDLLYLDGLDLRDVPLIERKRALAALLRRVEPIPRGVETENEPLHHVDPSQMENRSSRYSR